MTTQTIETIETGLQGKMDPVQAEQIAHWQNPDWSVVKEMRAFQRLRVVGTVTALLGASILAIAFLPELTKVVSKVLK